MACCQQFFKLITHTANLQVWLHNRCMLVGRLFSVPTRQLLSRARIHVRITAAASSMETATKHNVGASTSKSQTHVGLNSGQLMPLFGWGTAGVKDDACIDATKSAIELGYKVLLQCCSHALFATSFNRPYHCACIMPVTGVLLSF